MSEAEFIGMLVLALVVIIGFIVSIITPMMKLNTSITKLNDTMERLLDDNETQDKRLDKHRDEIAELKTVTTRHDTEIKELQRR